MNQELFEKLIRRAFHPSTDSEESLLAFYKARKIHIDSRGTEPPVFGNQQIEVYLKSGKLHVGPIPLTLITDFVHNISEFCWDSNLKHKFEILPTGTIHPFGSVHLVIEFEGTDEQINQLEVFVEVITRKHEDTDVE